MTSVPWALGQTTVWTNWSIGTGSWTNQTCWDAGVPNNNHAALTVGSGSYTVNYDTVANTFSNLTITNVTGNTTTLNINTNGFINTAGLITLRRGAVVNVNTGGEWKYVGSNSAYVPMLVISDDALINIAGGSILFTNLEAGSPGQSRIDVGGSSTGTLTMSSGNFMLTPYRGPNGTNKTTMLYIGINGAGALNMTGGAMLLDAAGGSMPLKVGTAASPGTVNLSGGTITLSGATYFDIGNGNGAMGTVNVSGNGQIIAANRTIISLGMNGGMGIWNMSGGMVDFRGDKLDNALNIPYVSVGNSTGIVTMSGGVFSNGTILLGGVDRGGLLETGTINLYGGLLTSCNRALRIGYAMSNSSSMATFNMTNGVLYIEDNLATGIGYGSSVPAGIKIGEAKTNYPSLGVNAIFNISGGIVTNYGALVIGANVSATGRLTQTGGTIDQVVGSMGSNAYPVIGFGGGNGAYLMSGGTFISRNKVFVGGVTPNFYNPASYPIRTEMSDGLLEVSGGTFTVSNTIYVGMAGAGTLTIGSNGTVWCSDLVMTNNTASTLRFEAGPTGVGMLTVTNNMTIGTGAKLEVDLNAYHGGNIKLVGCGSRTESFAAGNISIIGHKYATVDQNQGADIWLIIPKGTIFTFR